MGMHVPYGFWMVNVAFVYVCACFHTESTTGREHNLQTGERERAERKKWKTKNVRGRSRKLFPSHVYAVYGAMLYMLNPSIPSYVTIHNRIFSVRSEETENSNLENEKEKRTEKMFKCLQNGQGSRKFCGIFHATFHHFNCHGISIKDLINFATSIIFFAALSSISFFMAFTWFVQLLCRTQYESGTYICWLLCCFNWRSKTVVESIFVCPPNIDWVDFRSEISECAMIHIHAHTHLQTIYELDL